MLELLKEARASGFVVGCWHSVLLKAQLAYTGRLSTPPMTLDNTIASCASLAFASTLKGLCSLNGKVYVPLLVFFQHLEGCLAFGITKESLVFLCQVRQWLNFLRRVLDNFSVVLGEAKKRFQPVTEDGLGHD